MNKPTAADHLADAIAHDEAAEASFERCDTDGFLTQWAHGVMGQKARLQAQITADGDTAEHPALFDLAGNLIPAKEIETRYGWAWALLETTDPKSRFTGFFNPSNARKADTARRNDAKKGFYVGTVRVPSVADLHGGNAYCVSAYARRLDGGFSAEAIVVDNGHGEIQNTRYFDC